MKYNKKCKVCKEKNNECLCIWDYIYAKDNEKYIEIDGYYILDK